MTDLTPSDRTPAFAVDPKLLELLVCPLTKGTLIYDREKQELAQPRRRIGLPDPRRHPHHAGRRSAPADGRRAGGELKPCSRCKMTAETSQIVQGYVSDFSITKVFDQEVARFDLEISFAREWREKSAKIVVRFTDARKICYGDPQDGINFGAYVSLAIEDVSKDGWDGVRFKAHALEDVRLSLDCRRDHIEEVSMVSLPEHCTVLF